MSSILSKFIQDVHLLSYLLCYLSS